MRTFARLLLPLAAVSVWPMPAQGQSNEEAELRAELAELKTRIASIETRLDAVADARAQQDAQATPQAVDAPVAPTPLLSPAIASTRAANVLAVPLDQPSQDPNIGAAFQLTGSTAGGKRAELLLSGTVSRTDFAGGDETMGSFETVSLSASAPLGDDGPTNIGTLDGFDDGFKLSLRVTSYQTELRRPSAQVIRSVQDTAKANCLAREAASPNRQKTCDADPDAAFLMRYLSADAFEAYQDAFFGNTGFAWGLEASLGYKAFEFIDPATAASMDTERWPLGGKLFATWFPDFGETSLTGSIGYQRTYKAATTAALCGTVTAPFTQCAVGPLGVPTVKNQFLLSGGGRSYVPLEDFIIPGFALAPSVTYEVNTDVWGFDLPIYLLPDDKGNLIGGIRLGYETEEDDFAVGVFVGSKFSLGN